MHNKSESTIENEKLSLFDRKDILTLSSGVIILSSIVLMIANMIA